MEKMHKKRAVETQEREDYEVGAKRGMCDVYDALETQDGRVWERGERERDRQLGSGATERK